MNVPMRVVPLERRVPTPKGGRRSARFKVSNGQCLKDLNYELEKIGATQCIVEADVRREQIRNDGWFRSSARPASAAVRLSATTKANGELVFPCNVHFDFWDNLRAITLHLRALRDIALRGVGSESQAYRGWAALPSADEPSSSFADSVKWLAAQVHDWYAAEETMRDEPDRIRQDETRRKKLIAKASMACHPDTGGSSEKFAAFIVHRDRVRKAVA